MISKLQCVNEHTLYSEHYDFRNPETWIWSFHFQRYEFKTVFQALFFYCDSEYLNSETKTPLQKRTPNSVLSKLFHKIDLSKPVQTAILHNLMFLIYNLNFKYFQLAVRQTLARLSDSSARDDFWYLSRVLERFGQFLTHFELIWVHLELFRSFLSK